jgi:nicotinamidase/pyrazinamidase
MATVQAEQYATMNAKVIFVDVDTQVDFMRRDGKLYVPGASEIVANLKRLTDYARRNSVPVIATACAHREGDPEFQVFPPHCIKGTEGQRRIPETGHPAAPVIGTDPDAAVLAKFEAAGEIVLEKSQYDVFSNPNAARLIDALPDAEFVVYGVATDYCVRAATLGLSDRGRRVSVVTDAIRPVDPRQGASAIDEFRRRGVRLVTTDEVCSR